MKHKALNLLERAFDALATWATSMKERCAICTDCGRNRYTGKPCQGMARGELRTWVH